MYGRRSRTACNAADHNAGRGRPDFLGENNMWAEADGNYFHCAWADRSITWTSIVNGQSRTYTNRLDSEVEIAKIR